MILSKEAGVLNLKKRIDRNNMKKQSRNTKIFFALLLFVSIFMCLLLSGSGNMTYAMYSTTETFEVRGVKLPLDESGYGPDEYFGPALCWQFAYHIYEQIWGTGFDMYPDSEDDMLRNYPKTAEYRRITAQNAERIISNAEPGAVIRIQSDISGPDTTEGSRHSLILVQKDEYGCTLYHSWGGISTIKYYTWYRVEEVFNHYIDFGYFKYVKFPGAGALNADGTMTEAAEMLSKTADELADETLSETADEPADETTADSSTVPSWFYADWEEYENSIKNAILESAWNK